MSGAPDFTVPRAGHPLQSLPTVVGLFAVGSARHPVWWRAIALLPPVWMMAGAITDLWQVDPLELVFLAVVLVGAWGAGLLIGDRREHAEQMEAKAAELAAAQQALADRAVADERARIARELHDVVAHAMSVITVQAGVGGHLLATDPDQARKALGMIERTGREAMSELRRLLYVLHDVDHGAPDPGTPQPGLADVPALVEAAAAAGVMVTVETEGRSRPLPVGLDLTVYRVVQEALTNAAKHAPHARVTVRVRHGPDEIAVEVRDRGAHGVATGPVRPGHGLRGMAERVGLYDGAFEVAAEPDGFRVSARFPQEPSGTPVAP